MAKALKVPSYDKRWDTNDPIAQEVSAIRWGGEWLGRNGEKRGLGLAKHYENLQKLLWPWTKTHRWSDLTLSEIVKNKITLIAGPANCEKSFRGASYAVMRYIVSAGEMAVLVSSTDSRSLELKIFGEIKKLWQEAKQRWPHTPGEPLESKQMILTRWEDELITDNRRGIIGIPCVVSGTYVGLGKYVGIKNPNGVLLVADELAHMSNAFFQAIANLNKNPWFQCVGCFNPKDRTDVAGKLSEPADEEGGWAGGVADTEKTAAWDTRFPGGRCINLVGTDSPNFDVPKDAPIPFPHIITRQQIEDDEKFYGKDSELFQMFDMGVFPKDAQSKRVITRAICQKFRANEQITWSEAPELKACGLDAAYGSVGGDRCILTELHYGMCVDGIKRVGFMNSVLVPVSVRSDVLQEDQIVNFCKEYCEERNIPPSHLGLDSTGRGSLVNTFGRLWSPSMIAVEFGGMASERQVSESIKEKAKDYYFNMVSELWFATKYLIEMDMLRDLPQSVMEEGCLRAWETVHGAARVRIKVEPKDGTKEGVRIGMKQRTGRSPDLYDSFVVALEVLRRLGIVFGNAKSVQRDYRWLDELREQQKTLRESYALAS